jgi:hypothetical protein
MVEVLEDFEFDGVTHVGRVYVKQGREKSEVRGQR